MSINTSYTNGYHRNGTYLNGATSATSSVQSNGTTPTSNGVHSSNGVHGAHQTNGTHASNGTHGTNGVLHTSNGVRTVTSPILIPRSKRSDTTEKMATSPQAVFFVMPPVGAGQLNGQDIQRQLGDALSELTRNLTHKISNSPPGSASSSSSFDTPIDCTRAAYEDVQRKEVNHLTYKLLEHIVRGDLHVHFEGLLSADDLFEIARKMDQLRWDPTKKEFVSIQSDPNNPRLIRLDDLAQETVNEICAAMQACPCDKTQSAYERTTNFFDAFSLRENLMNQIGLAGLFPTVYEYLKGNRYVELMTVLNYKAVPADFEEIFKAKTPAEFLEEPRVREWIADYVRESRATLDACKHNLNAPSAHHNLSASQTLERDNIECFQVMQPGENPLTIRFSIEVMRNQELFKFFLKSAAACQLIKEDYRVVSFTICGPQNDRNSKTMMTSQSKMIQLLADKFGDKFKFNPHFAEVARSMVRNNFVQTEWNLLGKLATRRIGHAVEAFSLEQEIKEKGVAIEACLCSNNVTLNIPYKEHPLRAFLERGIRAVFGSDDPGVIDKSLLDNMVYAVNQCKLSFEQFLDCIRATATFSHLDGESIYQPNSTFVRPCFEEFIFSENALNDEAKQILKGSERAQLELVFEKKIQEFILQVAAEKNDRS